MPIKHKESVESYVACHADIIAALENLTEFVRDLPAPDDKGVLPNLHYGHLGKAAGVDAEPTVVETIVADTGVLKKPRKAKVEPVDGEKKLSCVGAALKVLAESEQPLNTKEMFEAMQSKGYWSSPGGKTPHATLYTAILRDLASGDDAKFVKTERGRFAART